MNIDFDMMKGITCPAEAIKEVAPELLNDPEVYFVYTEYLNAQNKLKRLLDKKEAELYD